MLFKAVCCTFHLKFYIAGLIFENCLRGFWDPEIVRETVVGDGPCQFRVRVASQERSSPKGLNWAPKGFNLTAHYLVLTRSVVPK